MSSVTLWAVVDLRVVGASAVTSNVKLDMDADIIGVFNSKEKALAFKKAVSPSGSVILEISPKVQFF